MPWEQAKRYILRSMARLLKSGTAKFWGTGRFYNSTPKPYTLTVCHGNVRYSSRMRRRCTCYTVGMPRCTLTHRLCAAAMRYMYNFTSRMRGKNVERDWRDCLAVHCASRCYQTTRWLYTVRRGATRQQDGNSTAQ